MAGSDIFYLWESHSYSYSELGWVAVTSSLLGEEMEFDE